MIFCVDSLSESFHQKLRYCAKNEYNLAGEKEIQINITACNEEGVCFTL